MKFISTRFTRTHRRPAYLLGPEFVVTSSLTKVYGLSGLRCGWILAEPDLARAMWRLNDLFASIPAHPAELLSVVALEHLEQIRQRARKIVEADRVLLEDFMARQQGISSPRTEFGTTAFCDWRKATWMTSWPVCTPIMRPQPCPDIFSDCPTISASAWEWTQKCFAKDCKE
jgi:histidinol-phosphate/aromatic aminotransferase/cobyric acid decarboxylase-like protein